MNFRQKFHYGKSADADYLIEAMVAQENRYGEIESLRAQVYELARIVGYMASVMPLDELRKLADHFGWEEVK